MLVGVAAGRIANGQKCAVWRWVAMLGERAPWGREADLHFGNGGCLFGVAP